MHLTSFKQIFVVDFGTDVSPTSYSGINLEFLIGGGGGGGGLGRFFISWGGGGGGGGEVAFGGKLYYHGDGLRGKLIKLGGKLPLPPPPPSLDQSLILDTLGHRYLQFL